MATLLVLYNRPTDEAAFDRYYSSTHAPLAKKIPGLRSYETSRGPVLTPSGISSYHLVATLKYDTMQDLEAASASPEGQAAAADLENFATGGASILIFDEGPA
jgi:uncharacterized protein (TIGR02118 family)